MDKPAECLVDKRTCKHVCAIAYGGMHYSAGEVWDDVHYICDICGAVLDHNGDAILLPQDEEEA